MPLASTAIGPAACINCAGVEGNDLLSVNSIIWASDVKVKICRLWHGTGPLRKEMCARLVSSLLPSWFYTGKAAFGSTF